MKSAIEKIRDGQIWVMGAFGETVPGVSEGYLGFTTGDVYVRLTNRNIDTDATSGNIALYKETTYSGGTPIPVANRNQRLSAAGFLPSSSHGGKNGHARCPSGSAQENSRRSDQGDQSNPCSCRG